MRFVWIPAYAGMTIESLIDVYISVNFDVDKFRLT